MARRICMGDCVGTPGGSSYIYLGKYMGRPFSMKNVPEVGHLYMYYKSSDSRLDSDSMLTHIKYLAKLGYDMGNFSYTKNKKANCRVGAHISLDYDMLKDAIQSTLGIMLIEA